MQKRTASKTKKTAKVVKIELSEEQKAANARAFLEEWNAVLNAATSKIESEEKAA